MGKMLPFLRQNNPADKSPRDPGVSVRTLWDTLEVLERVRPSALAQIKVIADEFLPVIDRDERRPRKAKLRRGTGC